MKNGNKIFTKKDLCWIITMLGYIAILILYYPILILLKYRYSIRIANIIFVCYFILVSLIYPRIIHKYKDKIKEKFKIL